MRVYEFAKEHGLSSKDIVALLNKQGFATSSHMAVLTDEAIRFLNEHFGKKAQEPVGAVPAPAPIEPDIKALNKEHAKQIVQEPEEEKKVLKAPIMQPAPKISAPAPKPTPTEPVKKPLEPKQVLLQPTILSDLALVLNKSTSDLILTLLKWGILSNKNQLLTEELVARIAQNYEVPVVRPVIEKPLEQKLTTVAGDKETLKERLPVVVVMGHVDHGKTTLLDFIRKTRVAAKEKGGITQHLGAYEAKTSQGNLVFIDTPGHEAFSKIRVRGTKVADIVILVVAADDGIMPQTVEALKHAQSMNVPIIVAINKIDKVDKARIDIVKRDLATQHNLLPEEWGGQTVYMPISGKTGLGVDKLLEMIVLQSQLMELQAQPTGDARGFVLESKLEKGRGPVATILTQQGLLKVGDHFIAGKTVGKISSMVDSYGQRVTEVAPSHPVQVAGFNELPEAGDYFEVVDKDAFLKTKQLFAGQKQPGAQRTYQTENAITLIVKTDTNSSKEALLESISKVSKKSEKGFLVLQSAIGNVNESDVMLASDTGSRIITLHVKSEPNAMLLAQRMNVSITSFDIIYKLLEYLQELSTSMAPVKMLRTKVGEAVVRKVFDIKNLGIIAGAYIKQGIFSRDGSVVVWRGTKKVGEGKITSLQRDKNTVKEVHAGYECAFMIEDLKDWQVDDRVECFVERPQQAPKK